MSTASSIAAEVRSHFLDCMTYLVPGGVFLLLAIESAEHFLRVGIFMNLATFWLISDKGAWRWAATAVVLVGLSYLAGLLLRIVDEWVPFPPLRVPPQASDPTGGAMRKLAEKTTGWRVPLALPPRWGWVRWLMKLPGLRRLHHCLQLRGLQMAWWESLYEVAEPIVLEKQLRAEAWVERYAALSNLCGGVAWAEVFGGLLYWLSIRSLEGAVPAHHMAPSWALWVVVAALFLLLKYGQADYGLQSMRLAMGSVVVAAEGATAKPAAEVAASEVD
jgi:hypothetical protein